MATLADHVIAQVVIDNDDGLPENAVTNTFHFLKDSSASYATAVAALAPLVAAFYNVIPSTSTGKVSQWLSNALKTGTNQARINCYDGSVPPGSRVPTTSTFTLGAPVSGVDLPNEVAVVASFRNKVNTLLPFSHQRGRIYLGPLCSSAMTNATSGPVPSAGIIADLCGAMKDLKAACIALPGNYRWCVYSPTSNALTAVIDGYVDNAFDTQRRRGPKTTSRTTWS